MASLQDLLLVRELRDQADPFRSGLRALAQGVATGIEEQRQGQLLKKRNQEAMDLVLGGNDRGNTSSEIIKSFKIENGEVMSTIRSATESEKKIIREEQIAKDFSAGVRNGETSTSLGAKFPMFAKDIKDLEELGVISPTPIQPVVSQQQSQIPTIGENGRLQTGQPVQRGDSVVTTRTAQGRPDNIISRSGKLEEGKIKTIGDVQKTQTEEAVKSIRSFNRVKSAAQGIVSASKRILKEQGGFGLVQQLKGKFKRGIAKTGLIKTTPEQAQGGQAELRGQLRETVLSLSPILTNQNRIIQGVLEMLSETLPKSGEPTTGTEFTAQLRQTTKNAYKLSKALTTGALSAEEIRDLNSGDTAEIKRKFKQILNKSKWTSDDEKDFNDEWKEIISVPATVAEDLFTGGGTIADKYGLNQGQ